jgi:hypothetical protein
VDQKEIFDQTRALLVQTTEMRVKAEQIVGKYRHLEDGYRKVLEIMCQHVRLVDSEPGERCEGMGFPIETTPSERLCLDCGMHRISGNARSRDAQEPLYASAEERSVFREMVESFPDC